MNRKQFLIPLIFLFISFSCDKKDKVPALTEQATVTLSKEKQEIQKEYSKYQKELTKAMNSSGNYIHIATIDKTHNYNGKKYSRVLVLMRDLADLDDFGFSLPGKERSEEGKDHVEAILNEKTIFWTDIAGNISFGDAMEYKGKHLVAEWWIPNNAGIKVSMHYGGDPCLIIDLSKK